MDNKRKVHMLIGLPGSGKSTVAKELNKYHKAEIVSTDNIREELFGDASINKKSNFVFKVFYDKLFDNLTNGKDVVIDSTNLERDKRIKLIKKIKNFDKSVEVIGHLLDTPYEIVIDRNNSRKRVVPTEVIDRYYKKFDFPFKGEGFDDMKYHHCETSLYEGINKSEFEDLVSSNADYDNLFPYLKDIPFFESIIGFNQENVFHNYLLCEHTYNVYNYVNELYLGSLDEDKYKMQLASLLHDIGKPFCKIYKPLKESYSYYGHEHVSSLIAFHFLKELGYSEDFIIEVIEIIEFHMLINYGGKEGERTIYHLVGSKALVELFFFKEADIFAK